MENQKTPIIRFPTWREHLLRRWEAQKDMTFEQRLHHLDGLLRFAEMMRQASPYAERIAQARRSRRNAEREALRQFLKTCVENAPR